MLATEREGNATVLPWCCGRRGPQIFGDEAEFDEKAYLMFSVAGIYVL